MNRKISHRHLLIVTAVVEGATALGLMIVPSTVASILLGAPFGEPSGRVTARVAGGALLALSLICWQVGKSDDGRAARTVVSAMLLYDVIAAAALANAGARLGISGIALWPAVVAHVALALWCVACLRSRLSDAT